MGIMGESIASDEWAIDPEALLIYSLEMARYEPRLFDQILIWLVMNSSYLDSARIKRILQVKSPQTAQLAGGVFQYISRNGDKRKWLSVVEICRKEVERFKLTEKPEALFLTKSMGKHPLASAGDADPDFLSFGLNRPMLRNPKSVLTVPINSKTNIRFLLRSLFGTGAKSECILYLLTHDGGHPREIAEEVDLFWLGIHQTLLEMSKSSLILKRVRGGKTEYWLSHKKWWEFLTQESIETLKRPIWLNWTAIYFALAGVWEQFNAFSVIEGQDYIKSSKLQDSLELLCQEFSRAGLDIPNAPSMGIPLDLYQTEVLRFLARIFGVTYISMVEK